ncbi:MAG: SMP-30/gluconolactonase/LRE family protein [Verrucomicrobiota bacterium]
MITRAMGGELAGVLVLVGLFAGMASGEEPVVPEGAEVRQLAEGFTFTEGPAKGVDGRIYFNDIPNERTHVYDPTTGTTEIFREDTGRANGLMFDVEGALFACEGGARRVTRQMGDDITVVAEAYDGKRLNSPNDLVLDEAGGLYFTDPRYGRDRSDMEIELESVYYVDREGRVSLATDDVVKPNGIIFSRDFDLLYIADPGAETIWVFDVTGPGEIANKRKFAGVGSDGMTIDERGNVYCTWKGEVWIFSPEGDEVARIECPEGPANCTFGGPDGKTLYITARKGFYAIDLNVAGGQAIATLGVGED